MVKIRLNKSLTFKFFVLHKFVLPHKSGQIIAFLQFINKKPQKKKRHLQQFGEKHNISFFYEVQSSFRGKYLNAAKDTINILACLSKCFFNMISVKIDKNCILFQIFFMAFLSVIIEPFQSNALWFCYCLRQLWRHPL